MQRRHSIHEELARRKNARAAVLLLPCKEGCTVAIALYGSLLLMEGLVPEMQARGTAPGPLRVPQRR
jgi:hypothetical protein